MTKTDRARMVRSGLAALALVVGLASCSGTRLSDVYRDPGYTAAPFRQVAVFALGTDPAIRHLVEDEFARRLPMGTRGIASYGIVPEAEQNDFDKARERIRAGGFDGVIIGRLVGVEGSVPWDSGSLKQVPISYRTLQNFYVTSYEETARASALSAPTVVRVQTNVYAVATETLVWSAASRTFDPAATRDVAGDLAKVVVEALQKIGVLTAE